MVGGNNASVDLCCSLALVARRIATSFVDPDALWPLLNGRLIALDKYPGVCPIGIGEVLCRLISKAFLQVVKPDILDAAGCLQLCAGQRGGCEAAIHSMREILLLTKKLRVCYWWTPQMLSTPLTDKLPS